MHGLNLTPVPQLLYTTLGTGICVVYTLKCLERLHHMSAYLISLYFFRWNCAEPFFLWYVWSH